MNGEAIVELSNRLLRPVEIGGVIARPHEWTLVDPASLITAGPSPQALGVATLGAVRDYLAANKDALDLTHLVVHVASPTTVTLYGPLRDRAYARHAYLTATCLDLTADWIGKYWPLEDFLVGLQTRVVDSDDRPRLVALLGNVKHESVKTAVDDGVTQIVQARAGVALVSDVAVPNPVLVAGYRTFRDIVQPASLFVVRVKAGPAGGLPTVGLFEADGGAWRLTAVERIRTWLTEAVPNNVAVLA